LSAGGKQYGPRMVVPMTGTVGVMTVPPDDKPRSLSLAHKAEPMEYTGLEFLLAYWMGRAVGCIGDEA